jgi:S-disulfanyl-L-cysteine oxidoreductase SoxD
MLHDRDDQLLFWDIAPKNITVFPDGKGLPVGRATAREGRCVYESRCAACHGARGEGVGDFPARSGGRGTLGSSEPVLTVGSYWPYSTTLWDYIHRAMPYPQPGSLTTNDVYGATACVLYLNGIVTEDQSVDQKTLAKIRMPNREGFSADGRGQ